MLHIQVFRTVRIPVGGKIHKQAGFASILLILLIGLALTTLIIGMVTSVRGLQGSSLTAHAQTQAQIKSAIGYQALSGFLNNRTPTQIATINSGSIKQDTIDIASYTKTTIDCPINSTNTSYFCFDIKANSGGASSIIRAVYSSVTTITTGSLTGSVFAGGLQVGGSAALTGNQTLQVKNGVVTNNSGANINSTLSQNGINITTYVPSKFVTPDDVRPYANYIFYQQGGASVCKKNNLYLTNTSSTVTETNILCSSVAGISYINGKWTVDVSNSALPTGVLWFNEAVAVNLDNNRSLVNSIISNDNIETVIPNGRGGDYNAYAPNFYWVTNASDKLERVCSTTLVTRASQYCNFDGTIKNMDSSPANIANILFLSGGEITLDSGNKKNGNFFGNIIASKGAGGTGSASGKFTGTGNINIKGNIVITGTTDTTQMNGNISINLGNGNNSGNGVPSPSIITNTLKSISYL